MSSKWKSQIFILISFFFILFYFLILRESYRGSRDEPVGLHRLRLRVAQAKEGPFEAGREKDEVVCLGHRPGAPEREWADQFSPAALEQQYFALLNRELFSSAQKCIVFIFSCTSQFSGTSWVSYDSIQFNSEAVCVELVLVTTGQGLSPATLPLSQMPVASSGSSGRLGYSHSCPTWI